MRKKWLIFSCIILLVICQVFVQCKGAMAITENQSKAIAERCDMIKDDLKKVQKNDAKVRVYLGSYYEAILTRFITPLNVRLVENNLSSAGFVENQNNFASTKSLFSSDYIVYQQSLEELLGVDCKNEPALFYEKLVIARQKRRIMVQDVMKMRNLISGNIKLVTELRGKL